MCVRLNKTLVPLALPGVLAVHLLLERRAAGKDGCVLLSVVGALLWLYGESVRFSAERCCATWR